jgi:DNA-binding CsgD family transcriptional regulator
VQDVEPQDFHQKHPLIEKQLLLKLLQDMPHMQQLPLSTRELEILNWILAGKTDWEIGSILRLSAKTVNFHAENVKRKLGTRSRIQAIAIALRDGMVPFPIAFDERGFGVKLLAPPKPG